MGTLIAVLVLTNAALTFAQPSTSAIDGHWEGSVDLSTLPIRIRLDCETDTSGLKAFLSILESRLDHFELPKITYKKSTLHFEVPPAWGLMMFSGIGLKPDEQIIQFDGDLREDGISGTLRFGRESFPLDLKRGYLHVPYVEEDISFKNEFVTLAGTLLLPRSKRPHPVVIFTHGSGGRTRDAHRYEADVLVRNGIACLLYDKRGAGKSRGASWEWSTFDELASDAEAAVNYLLTRKDIDHKQIGLFGLSQGAWLIEMVAARCPKVAFIIPVSGGGIAPWQQEIFYRANEMRDNGFSEEDVREASEFMKAKFDVAKTGLGWEKIDLATMRFQAEKKAWYPEYTGGMNSLTSARLWWVMVFSLDPARYLRKVECPLLGLFAGDDRTMPTSETKKGIEDGLKMAGNKKGVFVVFPNTNHSMAIPQEVNGRALRRVINQAYIDTVVSWLSNSLHYSKSK